MKITHRTVGVVVPTAIRGSFKKKRCLIGNIVVAIAILSAGCQTPSGQPDRTATGAFIGGLVGAGTGALIGTSAGRKPAVGALIGGAVGAVAGGVIGHVMDQIGQKEQANLQQNSPQTLAKIQHNDQVVQQQTTSSQTSSTSASQSPPPAQNVTPLTVDDVKALAGAGVKDDAIIAEIKTSNSKFSQQDITELQQANVSPSVIEYIQDKAAS